MYPTFSPLEASHAGAVAGVTVVIADDHPAMLASIAEILVRNGFDVVGQATDGQQALALIESTQPRLALVDVRMPRLSGIEVAVHAAEVASETAIEGNSCGRQRASTVSTRSGSDRGRSPFSVSSMIL